MSILFTCIQRLLYRLMPIVKYMVRHEDDLDAIFSYSDVVVDSKCIQKPIHLYDSTIGLYTYISSHAFISQTNIGKFCSIGPNLLCGWGIHPTNGISTSPMFYSTRKQNGYSLTNEDKIVERKRITIGNDVFIGANVTILDGVTIGDGAVIGAGAVVSKDIPPYAIAVGSPIRVIRYRYSEEQIAAMLRICWWNRDDQCLQDVSDMFFDIDAFIAKYDPLSSEECNCGV